MDTRTEETVFAAFIALLSEAVAVALFMAAAFVWLAIYETRKDEVHGTTTSLTRAISSQVIER